MIGGEVRDDGWYPSMQHASYAAHCLILLNLTTLVKLTKLDEIFSFRQQFHCLYFYHLGRLQAPDANLIYICMVQAI